MIKNFFTSWLICLALLFVACEGGDKNTAIPPGILSEEQFAQVLTDFSLAEGAANMNVKNLPIQHLDSAYAFDPLKDNNIRQGQYDSTIKFYSTQPERYKRVYERVLQNLTELEAKRNAIKKDSASK
jgi:hypothetical protein